MIHSTLGDQDRSFCCQVNSNIMLSKFFDDMRLLRPLRPLRSLRLLRSMRPLRIWMAWKSPRKQLLTFWDQRGCWGHLAQWIYHVFWGHGGHWGFQVLEINKLMARITLFWCFEKKYLWTEWWNFKWNSAIIQDWGCGGQRYYFQPNPRVISQISASHECTDPVFMT